MIEVGVEYFNRDFWEFFCYMIELWKMVKLDGLLTFWIMFFFLKNLIGMMILVCIINYLVLVMVVNYGEKSIEVSGIM
jgi:hypothetical protein